MKTPKRKSTARIFERSPHLSFPFSLQNGFTIIELLVVLTLIGLVSGVGIFSLVNYGNTQTIEQSVANIKGIIDEARFNAISSVKLETDSAGGIALCDGNLVAYKVDIISSLDSVKLYMECENSSNLVEAYTLPSSLNLGVDTTCVEIVYEAVVLNVSARPPLPCDISIKGFNQSRVITVDSIGNIRITK